MTELMRKTILILILAFICLNVDAEEKKLIKGCTGGMMMNTGYVSGSDNPYNYNASGVTFGLGGLARIQLGKHFRTGFEAYFSTVNLNKNIAEGSFNKMFWGGLLGDFFWKCGRFYPYIGGTVGGGMETSNYIFEGSKEDWLPEANSVFHKEAFFCVYPFAGVEFELTKAVRLNLKADYMFAFNKTGLNQPSGPRIYFGIIFAH